MKTYNKYKKKIFTTNDLIVGFNFIHIDTKCYLFFYQDNYTEHYDWIFYYDKKKERYWRR